MHHDITKNMDIDITKNMDITKNWDAPAATAGFDVMGSDAQWGCTDVARMRFLRALRRLKPMRRQHLPSLVTT